MSTQIDTVTVVATTSTPRETQVVTATWLSTRAETVTQPGRTITSLRETTVTVETATRWETYLSTVTAPTTTVTVGGGN